jgi:hypothetical protein
MLTPKSRERGLNEIKISLLTLDMNPTTWEASKEHKRTQ